MLFLIKKLLPLCDNLSISRSFTIDCNVIDQSTYNNGYNTIVTYVINDITRIDNEYYDSTIPDIDDHDYAKSLAEICENHPYVSGNGPFKIENIVRQDKRIIQQDNEELESMRLDIKAELFRKNENRKAQISLFLIRDQLTNLLSSEWFNNITDIKDLQEILLTPKFQSNRYYSLLYKLITELLEEHPILTSDFDVNAFGVNSTQMVYEYWVWYKILSHLKGIGFVLKDTSDLIKHFRDFIDGLSPSGKYSHYTVQAKSELSDYPVEIEIGYDCVFTTKKTGSTGKALQRTPDYYIKVRHGEKSHWYFMDAKYKEFALNKRGRIDYRQEIYDVSISKYIVDIGDIFEAETLKYNAKRDDIMGSYIIMANVEEAEEELAENNRLYGDSVSIFNENSVNQWNQRVTNCRSYIESENIGHPAHKYGAIHLSPTTDEELCSLFQLIFEYLESEKDDGSRILHYCWSCNTGESVLRQEKQTAGGYIKYHVTCPRCHAFRVDNHCISCGKLIVKHTRGNYHVYDGNVDNKKWAFVCPYCGATVNQSSVTRTRGIDTQFYQYENVPVFHAFEDDELPF